MFFCLLFLIACATTAHAQIDNCNSDISPDSSYTCEDQASWDKCDESWMQGYCCLSCTSSCDCDTSTDGNTNTQDQCDDDIAPYDDYTCEEQASWDKCEESWMEGYCCISCADYNTCDCSNSNSNTLDDCDSDIAPGDDYTCEEQSSFGQCDQSWMQGYCCHSCSNTCDCDTTTDTTTNTDDGNNDSRFLSIGSDGKTFLLNDKEVFLSGVNQAWVNYAKDFGNDQSNAIFCQLNYTLANVSMNSGNSIRMWLHTDASYTPLFDNDGYVSGTDGSNTLIDDMRLYLQAAAESNVLIFFVLWNGAANMTDELYGLITDESKLESYINNCLIPMVTALSDEPSLGGWEIINEPEGSIYIESDTTGDDCTDTSHLDVSEVSWTNKNIHISTFQKFINLQASAIHDNVDNTLVTVGSWSEKANTDEFGYTNFYKDKCLIAAGGKTNGILDFYQIHSYAWEYVYNDYSPFSQKNTITYDDYKLDKPLVIGEFASQSYPALSIESMYKLCYNNGFGGAWDWDALGSEHTVDNMATANKGMKSLSDKNEVSISIDKGDDFYLEARCWCSDILPVSDVSYTCQNQAIWGKCGEDWMNGYCCQSCDACDDSCTKTSKLNVGETGEEGSNSGESDGIKNNGNGSNNTGVIATVVSCVIVVAIAVGVIVYVFIQRRRKQQANAQYLYQQQNQYIPPTQADFD